MPQRHRQDDGIHQGADADMQAVWDSGSGEPPSRNGKEGGEKKEKPREA